MGVIETVRVGSHRTWHETTKGHGFSTIDVEYETRFHDCLPGKIWLEEHYQDVMPEPTIDILVDGQLKAHYNGNFKKGVISKTLGDFTSRVKIGRKMCIIPVGEADRVKIV